MGKTLLRPLSDQSRFLSSALGLRTGHDMPPHPQAVTALQEYLGTLPDQSASAYLFPGRLPGTRHSKTADWRAIKRVFAAAGIAGAPTEVGTHFLRKTFAQKIYTALSHYLDLTGYAMRHASVSTTSEYLSSGMAEVDAAILQI